MDRHTPVEPAPSPLRPTDRARLWLRRAEILLAALAMATAVTVGVLADLTRTAERGDGSHLAGLVAGVTTLTACWVLLGLGAVWWHHRLAAIDREGYAPGPTY